MKGQNTLTRMPKEDDDNYIYRLQNKVKELTRSEKDWETEVKSLQEDIEELQNDVAQAKEDLEEKENHYENLIYTDYIQVNDSEGLWGTQLHDLLSELIREKGAKFIYQKITQ